jgi:hypothetical protein
MSAFLSDSTSLRLQSIGRRTINGTKNEKVMVLGKWFLQAAHLSRTTSQVREIKHKDRQAVGQESTPYKFGILRVREDVPIAAGDVRLCHEDTEIDMVELALTAEISQFIHRYLSL